MGRGSSHPYELAWRIIIEWKGCKTLGHLVNPNEIRNQGSY